MNYKQISIGKYHDLRPKINGSTEKITNSLKQDFYLNSLQKKPHRLMRFKVI